MVYTQTLMADKSDDSSLILLEPGVGKLSVRSGDGGQPTAEPGGALILNDSARGRAASTWKRVTRRRAVTLVLPFDD